MPSSKKNGINSSNSTFEGPASYGVSTYDNRCRSWYDGPSNVLKEELIQTNKSVIYVLLLHDEGSNS